MSNSAAHPLSLLAISALLLAGSAGIARGSDIEGRTYTGTIGKAEIVACLGGDSAAGRYYYVKHGKTLDLVVDPTSERSWAEREPSHPFGDDSELPHWRLAAGDGDSRRGTWEPSAEARGKGRGTLPIRLQRIAEGCREFERRRTEVPEVAIPVSAPAASFVALSRHGLADVARLRLTGGAPPKVLASINRRLDEVYTQEVANSWECEDDELVGQAEIFPGDLLIADYSGGSYCGGPHPNEGYILLAFDLRDGEQASHEVAAGKWFDDLPTDFSASDEGLAGYLATQIDPVECKAEIAAEVYWPTVEGIAFRLWTDTRSGASCRQDLTVPWDKAVGFALPMAAKELATWRKRLAGRQPIVVSSVTR